MINLRAGAATLYHWARNLHSYAHTATRIDRAETRRALKAGHPDLDRVAEAVRRDGVVALPCYWNRARCEAAQQEIDRLLADYPEAVQIYSGGSDKRMFGVESASPLLMEFHADPFLRRFGELMGGLDIYNFATLGARIEAIATNTGSGGGWHRDAHGFQFKAILYLSDTSPDNGPFQYLPGSHKPWRAVMDTMLGDLPGRSQTRFKDQEVARLCARLGIEQRAFPAPAGTLLLVNTAGVHRGMPLKAGARYALTNYYYHRIDVDEARIKQFSPLVPGTAQRVRRDIGLTG